MLGSGRRHDNGGSRGDPSARRSTVASAGPPSGSPKIGGTREHVTGTTRARLEEGGDGEKVPYLGDPGRSPGDGGEARSGEAP